MKILYVEDEIFLGKIVKESLESRGFEICMVTDGNLAVGEFKRFVPDICVLDVMLPNKDGFEIAQEIRILNRNIPILFLTAKAQTEDVLQGFDAGGNDYLKKPFSMEELVVRLKNLRNMTSPSSESKAGEIKLGEEFVFYPVRQELEYRGSEAVKLSYREAELLKVLTENLNQKVLRKDILLRVWNDDSYFNSRNLDVYITKLRDYFKKTPNIEILTLKGVGYIFKTN